MNQTARTGVYLLAAIAALSIAWMARPAGVKYQKFDDTGQRFFDQFDPLEAKSLEIISVNPDTSARRSFTVAQKNGRWCIPSHEDYPADAQDHLAQAATSVMDVVKGSIFSDKPADHDLFGVADPAAEGASSAGAGMRVILQNGGGTTLVDLILGKPVKDSQDLRYVRVPSRDRVYQARVKTEQLSTKFEDWIERDLLQLDAYQINEVFIDGYSIDELNQRLIQGDQLTLRYDQTGNKWELDGLKPGEEMKTQRLEEMRTSLDNLQIVDVHRKPAGLSSRLQAEGGLKPDNQTAGSLASRGYYFVQTQPNGPTELMSNEGQTIVRTREGAEYTLRFGEVVNYETGTAGGEAASANPQTEAGRYLFVTARFDESQLEQPQYLPVPEPPPPPPPVAGTQPAESQPAATQPADDPIRQTIIDSNEQQRTEFQKKVADGQEKVKKLNTRFADWYYVVSDSVYQKIRMRRSDVAGPAGAQPPGPPTAAPPPMPGMPGASP